MLNKYTSEDLVQNRSEVIGAKSVITTLSLHNNDNKHQTPITLRPKSTMLNMPNIVQYLLRLCGFFPSVIH